MRRIVISGPQPVDMLDVAGPLEVFKLASKYEVILARPGRSSRLELNYGLTLSDAVPYSKLVGQIDTLVIAGGPGANRGQ